jgi:uncharacterized protein (TIGR00297 family)
LIFLIEPGNSALFNQFLLGFVLAAMISIFSLRIKFLTIGGSACTFVLALIIFGLGGWKWTLPIFSFFLVSSLLSKLREKKNPSVSDYFEKTGSRDFCQVLANGGLGGILVAVNYFFPNIVWYYTYSGIIASSCADTWATEVGTMTKHRTYDILRFSIVEQGSSGGVSLTGFIGALFGALFISLVSVLWIDKNHFDFILLITFAGFAASVFDSFLGASVQRQYKCSECGRVIDKKIHCKRNAVPYRGISFINNDLVNLSAGLFGGIIVLIATVL